ncbi:HAD family hydrolase [Chitinimonas sp.]|uniref:HAD family hydrolase n=1 Tax=Chitinimonas sp. TaxID=1934313 RepID=UPI0035B1005B
MQLDFTPAAILFDMDGLMIDSERIVLAQWRIAAAEQGMVFDDALLISMVGLHEKLCHALLKQRFPGHDLDSLFARTDALYAAEVENGLPLKGGIIELLQWLEQIGMPRAVATSTKRVRAEQKLRLAGLDRFFELVVSGDDIEHPKPAPDIYLQAAARLGVDPQRCLVLEDSDPGVRAALAAGMTAIQIPDLKPPSDALLAMGHRVLPSLHEAHQLLRQRFAQTSEAPA